MGEIIPFPIQIIPFPVQIIPFPVQIIPLPVWIIPFPVLKIYFEDHGINEKHFVKEVELFSSNGNFSLQLLERIVYIVERVIEINPGKANKCD